jgi:hypothetical protein
MPNTRPFCSKGNADTSIAGPVVLVRAAPPPCSRRKIISHKPDGAMAHKTDDMENKTTPILKRRRMPVKSPNRPTGSNKMAMVSKNAVTTQLRVTASSPKLFSISGSAILIEDMRKVPIKEVIATMTKIDICFLFHDIKQR